MTDRWGITFPLEGVPLLEHREVLQEAERLGYTDAWTAEVDGTDAFVPLANMFGYINTLRSMSSGRANFTMQFDHYEPVPQNISDEIQAKFA